MIRESNRRNRNDCFERTLMYISKIMAFTVLLIFAFTFVTRIRGGSDDTFPANSSPELEILPSLKGVENTLHKRDSESLNLTCRISWRLIGVRSQPHPFNITWVTPKSGTLIDIKSNGYNSLSLYVSHLLPTHSGDYSCEARDISKEGGGKVLRTKVRVSVLKNCSPEMFVCPLNPGSPPRCISKHYVCDGKQDCYKGEDESLEIANCDPVDPCKDKLQCENGRCIPLSWCCPNTRSDCNVTHLPPCCRRLNQTLYPAENIHSLRGIVDDSESQSLNHMGFLQTTIYTVIGCAMAFMFIVTILVIAICRVHMKRTLMAGTALQPGGAIGAGHPAGLSGAGQQGPLYDLDVYLSSHPGLLVTYNINNGVQFVGRPIDPPPYCEVVASPPREGPPPPYVSHENLSRIPIVEDESEDCVAHECDALLSTTQHSNPSHQLPEISPLRVESGGTATCSTQTGNPEAIPATRSLFIAPATADTGIQVSSLSEASSLPSSSDSLERNTGASTGTVPTILRDVTVGRLRESCIGLRSRIKEEPVCCGLPDVNIKR